MLDLGFWLVLGAPPLRALLWARLQPIRLVALTFFLLVGFVPTVDGLGYAL